MTEIQALISSNIRIALLKILALNPDSAFNINELSRRTQFSLDIPLDSGHPFRSISATCSGAFRPPIPEYFGHSIIQYNF